VASQPLSGGPQSPHRNAAGSVWVAIGSNLRLFNKSIDLKGELFSSTFTFGITAVIRLGSSLILTRILSPESYGMFGILFSFLFMIELLSDVGTFAFLIRHKRGNERRFVHTVWTVRLLRCCMNFGIVFLGAPLIAALYGQPVLTNAFRVLSFWFLLTGAESMSFVLASRDRRARISNYADMISNAVMTVFVIVVASKLKNHYALIYGALLQRALMVIASHMLYRHIGVRLAFDREALKDQFQFARVVMPSSILTIILSQYDKVIFLKLFDLRLLGIYGVAGNMIGPITGVITHNARVVLYARCAEYFRSNRESARERYYGENKRLLFFGMVLPALVAGFSGSIVAVLYDSRYELVGHVLMVLGLGAIIAAFHAGSENLLVAYGRTRTTLVANVVRLFSIVPASLLGYYFYGFNGFLWFNLAATIPLSVYFFTQQRKFELLQFGDEMKRAATALSVFFISLAASHLFLSVIPSNWLHLGLKRH
jgi:O-antigen/teichoic acid export membrane protein